MPCGKLSRALIARAPSPEYPPEENPIAPLPATVVIIPELLILRIL